MSGGIGTNDKVRMYYDSTTGEAGMQIRMTNMTGTTSNKGYLCHPSTSTNSAFNYCIIDEPDITSIVYDEVADGEECWVWIQGLCQVYYMNAVTREWMGRNRAGAEGGEPGQGYGETKPTSPFDTDKHFQEVGHIQETTGGAGVALTVIHFN